MFVAESAEDDQILELDRDKLYLVADTFSSANMYLHSKLQHGYLGLNGPDLYSFQLPHPDVQHNGVTEVHDNFDVLYNWEKENAFEINMIDPGDEEKLGVLQHDLETGELYMLLPLEIDLLLQPDDDFDMCKCSINVPHNDQLEASITNPDTIPEAQRDFSQQFKSDERKSSINDRKNANIDRESNLLIGLKNKLFETDPYSSPASTLAIDLNIIPEFNSAKIHLRKDLREAVNIVVDVNTKSKPEAIPETKCDVSSDTTTKVNRNPAVVSSQVTLTQNAEPPGTQAENAGGAIRSICDMVVPQMSLKFSLSFNFDEICINPKDYERISLFQNRNIHNFPKMHKQRDMQSDKQNDKQIDKSQLQVMELETINNVGTQLATKDDGKID